MDLVRMCPRALVLGLVASISAACQEGEADDPSRVRWRILRSDVAGSDVALAPDGSIYVVGVTGYTQQGDDFEDVWLGRFDADGMLLWETRWPRSEEDDASPSALAVDVAGNVYLTMWNFFPELGNNRLHKLDPDGGEIWTAIMPGRALDVAALPGGEAIVVGARDPLAWAQHVADDGTLGWARTFGEPDKQSSVLSHVALAPDDGGVLLGGRLGLEPDSSRAYAWVTTLDRTDGSERWQIPLSNGTVSDRIGGLGFAAEGDAIVASTSANHGRVAAFDSGGAGLWSWDDDSELVSPSLAVFLDGSFAVGGLIFPEPPACSDASGSCPGQMRIERVEHDRAPRWSFTTSECSKALAVIPTFDDGLLALANCGEMDAPGEMGLFRLEP